MKPSTRRPLEKSLFPVHEPLLGRAGFCPQPRNLPRPPRGRPLHPPNGGGHEGIRGQVWQAAGGGSRLAGGLTVFGVQSACISRTCLGTPGTHAGFRQRHLHRQKIRTAPGCPRARRPRQGLKRTSARRAPTVAPTAAAAAGLHARTVRPAWLQHLRLDGGRGGTPTRQL